MPSPQRDQSSLLSAPELSVALCRGCLRLTFTTCSVLHLIHNKCLQLSTFIVPPLQCAEAMGQAAAIPVVPPPCSHCRIESSELPSSVTKPNSLTGSMGSVRLGRQEEVKWDTGTAYYALLATPPRHRTCSSSPMLRRRPCPLHWGGLLQQKVQVPWTSNYPGEFSKNGQRTTEPWRSM